MTPPNDSPSDELMGFTRTLLCAYLNFSLDPADQYVRFVNEHDMDYGETAVVAEMLAARDSALLAENARLKTERDEAAGTALDRLVTATQALAEADGLRAENARLRALLVECLHYIAPHSTVMHSEERKRDLLAKLKAEGT